MPVDAPDLPWDWLAGRRPGAGVIYITVKDREQNVRGAWLKVGGLLAYFLDLEPEVAWDKRAIFLRR
jgi:hypothetical protein